MRRNILSVFLTMTVITLFAQSPVKYFRLTDSVIEQDAIYRSCTILFDLNGHSNILDPSYPCLDSLADFMNRHPEIIWEVASHTDQRGSDSSNAKLSQSRANMVKNYLIRKGVPEYNLVAVGYGENFPLADQKTIDAEPGKAGKENLYQLNQRIEFKALVVPSLSFKLTDTAFVAGSVMRLPVLYDFAKGTLRPESMPLLDSLADFLLSHPRINIEVSNHTDSRTSNAYSSCLSCNRAKTVGQYLISKGVPANQLITKGYKESALLIGDEQIKKAATKDGQEELHRVNRRTEIKIISITVPDPK